MNRIILSTLVLVLFTSCQFGDSFSSVNSNEVHIPTVNNNVCKKLKEKVVLYAIFVDSRYTNPWTEHDIYSTIDSIQVATNWIESEASNRGVPLNIEVIYHQDKKEIIPIEANLMRQTLSKTLFGPNGVRYVDRWADKVAKTAMGIYGKDTTKVTRTKIVPKDRERLLARVRDEHKTDNVALVYFINNYYTNEVSVAIHTAQNFDPEYAIVSFKQPAVIAHEFLHLFGALDLYRTPFDSKRKANRSLSFAQSQFPNEIMAFPYRGLDSLTISPFTEYLVGWDRELDQKYEQMITRGKVRIAKY
ncbi:MAG: hypothetical protein AAGC47_11370 [Bacteroidota bacterium]